MPMKDLLPKLVCDCESQLGRVLTKKEVELLSWIEAKQRDFCLKK